MLAGDSTLVTTLRGLKSAILYVEVAEHKRDQGLSDAEVEAILAKEAKKRQDSADLFTQGGNAERAAAELAEKAIIEAYLPTRLTTEELQAIITTIIAANPDANMGQVIGLVKQQTGSRAEGGAIAGLVKAQLG